MKHLRGHPEAGNIYFLSLVILGFFATIILLVYPTTQGRRPFEVFPPDTSCKFCPVGSQGIYHFVLAEGDHATNLTALRKKAVEYCVKIGNPQCVVSFWSDAAMVPARLPLGPASARAEIARFQANWETGKQLICPLKAGVVQEDDCF